MLNSAYHDVTGEIGNIEIFCASSLNKAAFLNEGTLLRNL